MSDVEVLPELKQIIGAMLFAAKAPLSLGEIRRVLQHTGEAFGGDIKEFAKLKEPDIAAAMEQLSVDLIQARAGVHVSEVASGFRLNNDAGCGPWLRILLDKGRSNRLSKPALETLAIVAYRQPVTRGEIEGVRGVQVDAIIRNLMELQLVKIVGRSELPGKPWLFGTTQKFLESFGLRDMTQLPSIQELRRIQSEQEQREIEEAATRVAGEAKAEKESNNIPAAASNAVAGEATKTKTSEEAEMGIGREDIDRDYEGEIEDEVKDEDEDDSPEDDEDEYEDDDEDDDEDDEDEEEDEDEAKPALDDEAYEKSLIAEVAGADIEVEKDAEPSEESGQPKSKGGGRKKK